MFTPESKNCVPYAARAVFLLVTVVVAVVNLFARMNRKSGVPFGKKNMTQSDLTELGWLLWCASCVMFGVTWVVAMATMILFSFGRR